VLGEHGRRLGAIALRSLDGLFERLFAGDDRLEDLRVEEPLPEPEGDAEDDQRVEHQVELDAHDAARHLAGGGGFLRAGEARVGRDEQGGV
jgi:hypothetical protein